MTYTSMYQVDLPSCIHLLVVLVRPMKLLFEVGYAVACRDQHQQPCSRCRRRPRHSALLVKHWAKRLTLTVIYISVLCLYLAVDQSRGRQPIHCLMRQVLDPLTNQGHVWADHTETAKLQYVAATSAAHATDELHTSGVSTLLQRAVELCGPMVWLCVQHVPAALCSAILFGFKS